MKRLFKIVALVLCFIPVVTLATACGETNDFVLVSGSVSTNYKTFAEAYQAAESGDKIVLHKDAMLDKEIVLDKSITLDGQSKYTIKAKENFTIDSTFWGENTNNYGNKMFFISKSTPNVTLTLKNVTLDANRQGRVLVAQGGKVVVDGATLTGGLVTNNYVGGVYITNAAQFKMTSGSITGNKIEGKYAEDNYLQYSADLWIGANAVGSIASITGGTVGNVFVNSNEYSANNPGSFTLNGGTITNVYVEYDRGFGGSLKFESGTITKLLVSTTTSGIATQVTAVAGNTYVGGSAEPTPIA